MTGQRIALCLQYDGGPFCGWQRQPQHPSVQQTLDEAIEALDPLPAGVDRQAEPHHCRRAHRHRRPCRRPGGSLRLPWADPSAPLGPSLNGRLPGSIRVRASAAVAADWHACFSAQYRRYRYCIYNARRPNLFLAPISWHRYQWRLQDQLMEELLQELLGHHDFSAFQRAGSQRAHARTTVQEVSLERDGDILTLEIQASGFLYGMVRLLVGQLVAAGEGRISPEQFRQRWRQQRRDEVKEAAPPQGLCLLRVGYPEPVFPRGAWYDCQPRYRLETSDPPPEITSNPTGEVL